ncbi:MAG: hypothetical protein FD180_776 [Planctomycetota bacterium]|nr:MAG: hypothetical protein FD180_776 [Planctomycetota bacterium]
MKPWIELTHYAGFDWASDHHDVVVVDKSGAIVADFRIPDTAEGWRDFAERVKKFAVVGMVVETRYGAMIERMLGSGCTVFPIDPKKASRYRERKTSSGAKTDRLDAWSMADALRLDGQAWKPLKLEDTATQELRQLCRDEVTLIEQRTALVNQIQQALHEYYPTALEAFDNWTHPATWDFVIKWPTPEALKSAGKRYWEKFLHVHRLYRPETHEKRLACFARATEFCGSPGTTAAKSLLAVSLAKTLLVLQKQLDEYRARITTAFEQHPDHDVFGSLPGAGEKIGPRILGEIGTDRDRFEDPQALQCYAGTAPVTQATGKRLSVHMRRACNLNLRQAIHFLADRSRKTCAWAQAYYLKKKEEGHRHSSAMRCLGQRWIKIIWAMWRNRKKYDPDLHQRNQVAHGSWVIALMSEKP